MESVPDRVQRDVLFSLHALAMADRPEKFTAVDVDSLTLGELVQDGKLFATDLQPALHFVSSTLRALDTPQDNSLFVEVKPELLDFIKAVEDKVKTLTAEGREQLFPNKNVSVDSIHARYKSYVTTDSYLKLRMTGETRVFNLDNEKIEQDQILPSSRLRAVISASQVLFGRTEFGLVWIVSQVKLLPTPAFEEPELEPEPEPEPPQEDVCLIDDAESVYEGDSSAQEQYDGLEVRSVQLGPPDSPRVKRKKKSPSKLQAQDVEKDAQTGFVPDDDEDLIEELDSA